jgi:hypothetical protein
VRAPWSRNPSVGEQDIYLPEFTHCQLGHPRDAGLVGDIHNYGAGVPTETEDLIAYLSDIGTPVGEYYIGSFTGERDRALPSQT